MKKYNFDSINNRYNTGSYKYDRIKTIYQNANEDSIILTLADMDFKTAPEIRNYLAKTAEMGIYGYMTEYYDPYQEAVIKWFSENHDLLINKEEIIYSNGTIEALKAIIGLYTNKEDYIALSRPIYAHFTYSIEQEMQRRVKNIPLINNNGYYEFDFDQIYNELKNSNVKIYLLCSPHNPVGRVWKHSELKRLVEICKETNTLLVSDEVHCDIIRKDVKHIPILKINTDGIIMLTSPGKTFNMSGLQICNIIIKDKKILEHFKKNFERDINTFSQKALIAAYNYGKDWKNELISYLDGTIDESINYIKENMPYCEVFRPEGTYFLWLNFNKTGLSNDEINNIIYNKANVLMQDGLNVDDINGNGFQRMPIAAPRSIILKALKRIKKKFELRGDENEKSVCK